ncbi:GRIN2-like protein [Parambassis ranga]|uniref:GRIN2-like protein n=1 Tax=Parambassis ranga TaxID=210632 RepID=A0A6P7JS62_9TELE|nr:GRIN2-like protein [Parambassis ranga]
MEPSCNIQHTALPASGANHLTLPRLISSVSETGLDAKHLLHCCNLSCSKINSLPPGPGGQPQKHFSREDYSNSPRGQVRSTYRDIGTMTACKVMIDVGVQTGQTTSCHVFPQICLADDNRGKTSFSQTPNIDSPGGKKLGDPVKSPVKEVKWDAEGMTWEVYGASVDPEELGLAIQRHLELQIKETAHHAAKLSRQNTSTSQQSKNTSCQKKRSRMICIQTPACCSCNSGAVD